MFENQSPKKLDHFFMCYNSTNQFGEGAHVVI